MDLCKVYKKGRFSGYCGDKLSSLRKEIISNLTPQLIDEIGEIKIFGSYLRNPEQANDIDVHMTLKDKKYKESLPEFNKIANELVDCFEGKTFDGKRYDIVPETVETKSWFRERYVQIL